MHRLGQVCRLLVLSILGLVLVYVGQGVLAVLSSQVTLSSFEKALLGGGWPRALRPSIAWSAGWTRPRKFVTQRATRRQSGEA